MTDQQFSGYKFILKVLSRKFMQLNVYNQRKGVYVLLEWYVDVVIPLLTKSVIIVCIRDDQLIPLPP
jgi:hypothetical protein